MNRLRPELIFTMLILLAAHAFSVAAEPSTPSGVTWIDPAGIPGSLVIHGGGRLPDSVRDKFHELAGGENARIVVIPTASDQADEAARHDAMLEPWKSLGVADVQVLHTRSKEKANDETLVEPLKKATAVWFGGGQQSRIADAYLGTAVEREIMALLARGGVIGGTSAGAAIQSKTMIAGGRDEPEMAIGFDLLSGAIVDQHFVARNRQPRLRKALADHQGLVGFGMDEETALVVRGRTLEVLGNSTVSVLLAASASRPAREFELKHGERHDLTMLRRAAIDRTLTEFPPRDLPEPKVASGTLVIVGGGGMPDEATKKFVELAGGPDALIVVLPTAIGDTIPERVGEVRMFERAGANNVKVLRQRTRAEIESPEFAAVLGEAKGVWFGGGRQWRFIDAYAGTKAEELLAGVLARGGVIGGSSAGATIQGQYLVRGSVLGNEEMMAEGYERGLGFLPGVAIDQHFTQRGRQKDMTAVMQRYPQLLGIGIDERTALFVSGQEVKVVGSGQVCFYDYRNGCPTGDTDYTALKAGQTYDLVARKTIETPADPAASRASGIEKRVLWTTSRVVGSPEPPPPYKTERAFAKLNFFEPLDLAAAPGTDRLFVAERKGKIFSFRNTPDADKADLVAELKGRTEEQKPTEAIIYGFTFHPRFTENRFIYVTYIPNPTKETPTGTRLARFSVSKSDPPTIDLASELTVLEWPNGGHNGGCLKFGPDGMLYIATGDGSGIADELQTGQNLSDLLGAILRIDIDHPAAGKNYSIPKDNPFVSTADARPEIYAYGLRQPWRFSFDPRNGDLWAGEIGQDLWEMILRIEKGGNYGWSVQEGNYPFRPERPRKPTPILKPVVEHPHSDFRSIVGGFVYRGSRLPELSGHYIYADFDTGRIWAFQYPGLAAGGPSPHTVSNHRELAQTNYRIVSIGEDAAGEIYFVDFTGGLYQLVKAPPVAQQAAFPRKLSETGIFASTKNHEVAPGIIPYSVNSELWTDHATKERFIAIPGEGKIGLDEITYPQPSPGAPPGWRFPDGTVLVKTFSMEMERGNPASRKRLETRLLHFQKFPGTQEYGDQYWRGYTYVWNDEQTDAELLDAKGLDRTLKIKDGDKLVEQTYRLPSRIECSLCHTQAAKFALGVNTMQMNREHDYDGIKANQLTTLAHIGIFDKPLPASTDKLPKLADYNDESLPLDTRARAYLHSNCAHCHVKWGGGNAEFKLVATLPLEELGIANVPPGHGTLGVAEGKLLVPGAPDKSLIAHRMKITGLGRMPHIGSRVPHETAIDLLNQWIAGLPGESKVGTKP